MNYDTIVIVIKVTHNRNKVWALIVFVFLEVEYYTVLLVKVIKILRNVYYLGFLHFIGLHLWKNSKVVEKFWSL